MKKKDVPVFSPPAIASGSGSPKLADDDLPLVAVRNQNQLQDELMETNPTHPSVTNNLGNVIMESLSEKSPAEDHGISGITPSTSTSIVDSTPKAPREGQKRDSFGRFKEVAEKLDVRSNSQKQRDRVFSHVSRWKKAIETTIDKIQKATTCN